MIQITFKNLEKTEIARTAAIDRVQAIVDKFPDLEKSKIVVTLEMENSPFHPGPDHFTVKLHVSGGRYHNVTVTKSEPNLYLALAEVVEHMLEKLNRFGDRKRVKQRNQARQWTLSHT